jgi:hypothetical protein
VSVSTISRDICLRCPDTQQNGRGGIRTPETRFARLTVFKTAAFNRSATLPSASILVPGGVPAVLLVRICTALRGHPSTAFADALPPCGRIYTGIPFQGEVAEWLKALAC